MCLLDYNKTLSCVCDVHSNATKCSFCANRMAFITITDPKQRTDLDKELCGTMPRAISRRTICNNVLTNKNWVVISSCVVNTLSKHRLLRSAKSLKIFQPPVLLTPAFCRIIAYLSSSRHYTDLEHNSFPNCMIIDADHTFRLRFDYNGIYIGNVPVMFEGDGIFVVERCICTVGTYG